MEYFGFLSEGDLALLLRAIPQRLDKEGHSRVDDLRDKAMLALLSLQVLRTEESGDPTSRTCSAVTTSGRYWCAARAMTG